MSVVFNIGLYHYLILALVIFCIGLWGIVVCKNIIKLLVCAEFILNAAGINFVAFASYVDVENLSGLVFSLFITIFAIAELVLGVLLLISIYKYKRSADVEKLTDMKG